MTSSRPAAGAVAIVAALTIAAPAAADERAELRLSLQASMQRHIERNMIDDRYVSIDFSDGAMVRYVPTKAHSVILEGEGYFVLCSEMRNAEGKSVPVDYYLARAGRGYRVFKTVINDRGPLKAMMKAGQVRKL